MFKKHKCESGVSLFSTTSIAKKVLLLLLSLPTLVHADAIQSLDNFFHSTPTMRATFHQTVLNKQGVKIQDVTGVMQLQRTGKFRWDYNKPFVRVLVGDGKKVWLFDSYMNQVTVRAFDKALGSSPAALLSGIKDLNTIFNLTNSDMQDGLEWVEATPKDEESNFELVRLGFKEDTLQKMELHDKHGNTTVIELTHLERNPKLEPKLFRFKPPAGADVSDEES